MPVQFVLQSAVANQSGNSANDPPSEPLARLNCPLAILLLEIDEMLSRDSLAKWRDFATLPHVRNPSFLGTLA